MNQCSVVERHLGRILIQRSVELALGQLREGRKSDYINSPLSNVGLTSTRGERNVEPFQEFQ